MAKNWWDDWKTARSDSHTVYGWRRLEADVFPVIGLRPVADIEVYNGSTVTNVAIQLLAITFVRTSELMGKRWEEFDLARVRWGISAPRMTMKTPHWCPSLPGPRRCWKPLHLDRSERPTLSR